MPTGPKELRYAAPIADALLNDRNFLIWFVEQTRFSSYADSCRVMAREQKATRSQVASNWWRHYYVGKNSCRCNDCRERETDLLAVMETKGGYRFALHVEVKAPGDPLRLDQGLDYTKRAHCWAGRGNAPKTVVPHDAACTALICERSFSVERKNITQEFSAIILIEDISLKISPYPAPEVAH